MGGEIPLPAVTCKIDQVEAIRASLNKMRTLMLLRERQIMSLEEAIKKMTFLPASIFGIHDRGLIRRGMAADLFVFDPEKIDLAEPEKVTDLPEGAPRYIQRAKGIRYTIVNGSVLMKNGAHTGVYPGKVLRSS